MYYGLPSVVGWDSGDSRTGAVKLSSAWEVGRYWWGLGLGWVAVYPLFETILDSFSRTFNFLDAA